MKLNITQKLILIIVLLVIVPVLATGFMANSAAKEIVTQLLNQSQITLAREIAEQASQLFRTARLDTKMLSALPALSDHYYNHFYSLYSEAEISRKQIEDFFLDMARKSNFYYRICYFSAEGRQIVNITQGSVQNVSAFYFDPQMPVEEAADKGGEPYVSSVLTMEDGRRTVQMTQPLTDVWGNRSGFVVLELDFDRITDSILERRVGEQGYAMVIDTQGRMQVHPDREYLGKRYDMLGVPSMAELIPAMLRDRQGMAPYENKGSKVAAYTPVTENGWIVAITLPESEFVERVNIIRERVLLIVMLAASITVGVGIIFSWHFVRPIKELALATNVISAGRLPAQIESASNDELGILTRSFNHMVRNLRRVQAELVKSEKLGSLGRLATGVAHEIRNPLNSIKIAAEILDTKQPSAKEAGELMKLIRTEVSHLDNFVTNFLSYARQPPPNAIDVDANQLIRDILHSVSIRLENTAITLDMELADDLPVVPMDPFQMERALLNIIINAIDAMPRGGRLKVRTLGDTLMTATGTQACFLIEVADSGAGLPAEQLQHVFDPFFTTKEHGTGLGLSLTKSIVEAHGGSIFIEAGRDGGVIARIRLPEQAPESGEERSDETV